MSKLRGDAHDDQSDTAGPPSCSRRHSNVAPASLEKVQVGVVSLPSVPGPLSIEGGAGLARSSTKSSVSTPLTLLAASRARSDSV
jgi:hypothetical protein